jgi:hypothetical protein
MGANYARVVQPSMYTSPLTVTQLREAVKSGEKNKFRQSSLFEHWSNAVNSEPTANSSSRSDMQQLNSNNDVKYGAYGTIMPASIQGSKQYCNRKLLDLTAMIGKFGNPHFFVTLTANDSWSELQQMLAGRPSIFAPVTTATYFIKRFHTVEPLLFGDKSVFGPVAAFFYRVEFQRRGAPHVHCFVWVNEPPKTQVIFATREPLPDLVARYYHLC